MRIAAEVDQELPGLETDARYQEIEARMRRHAEAEAADLVARQAETQQRAERRVAARAEAEAQAVIEAAARQVLACVDCGLERSAGLCEACGYRRRTKAMIVEACLVAATWSAGLTDPGDVATVSAQVRAAVEHEIAETRDTYLSALDPAEQAADPGGTASVLAFGALHTVEQLLPRYRRTALARLEGSEEAQAEARKAYTTELAKPWFRALPDSDDAQRAATEAAAKAQTRTAEHLLAVRLEQLRTQARPAPVRPAPWAQRLPEVAARPLDGEALEVIA